MKNALFLLSFLCTLLACNKNSPHDIQESTVSKTDAPIEEINVADETHPLFLATSYTGKYYLDQLKLDSAHQYGVGDYYGTIYSYSDSNRVLMIDSNWSSEYAYCFSFFEFEKGGEILKKAHIKRLSREYNHTTDKVDYEVSEELLSLYDSSSSLKKGKKMTNNYVKNIQNLVLKTVYINDSIIKKYKEELMINWIIELEGEPMCPDSLIYIEDKSIAYNTKYDSTNRILSFHLYRYTNEQWNHFQTLDSIESLRADDKIELLDYNFDEKLDIRIQNISGGRGGNTCFDVFLWNESMNQFTTLKDAKYIPNLEPDASCQCVTAMILSGSATFDKYSINKDSLIKESSINVFARHDGWTFREYYTYDKLGKPTLTSTDSIFDNGASAFDEKP